MKIESFDTIFSLPVEQLNREQIISILIDDDLNDLKNGWDDSICHVLINGFVGYRNQTDAELRDEYTERRDCELCTYGTDAENGITVLSMKYNTLHCVDGLILGQLTMKKTTKYPLFLILMKLPNQHCICF